MAEDNPVNQRLAAAMLGKMGHSVTLANNGLEAIAEWNRRPFDLLFMDVQMPEMDGLEAVRQIRKQELAKGTRSRIIAMTANVLDGDRELLRYWPRAWMIMFRSQSTIGRCLK